MTPLEIDPAKDKANQQRHGISLYRFGDMDVDNALVVPGKTVNDEQRWMFLGKIDARLYAGVVTYRGDVTRVISLRPASRAERRTYDQAH